MQDLPESGFLFIDKPAGWTSFDVVAKLRGITGIKKIGHTGTLDPFATGLLIIAIGRQATKQIDQFMKLPKTYEATFTFGATTETLDPEGEIQPSNPPLDPVTVTEEIVDSAMQSMLGDSMQTPPMFSAIKKDGKKLYELARQGKEIERPARPITISTFERTSPIENSTVESPTGTVPIATTTATVAVSSGTYIRVIAQDLAEKLDTTGYLTALRRTAIADFSVDSAYTLPEITRENWRTLVKHATLTP